MNKIIFIICLYFPYACAQENSLFCLNAASSTMYTISNKSKRLSATYYSTENDDNQEKSLNRHSSQKRIVINPCNINGKNSILVTDDITSFEAAEHAYAASRRGSIVSLEKTEENNTTIFYNQNPIGFLSGHIHEMNAKKIKETGNSGKASQIHLFVAYSGRFGRNHAAMTILDDNGWHQFKTIPHVKDLKTILYGTQESFLVSKSGALIRYTPIIKDNKKIILKKCISVEADPTVGSYIKKRVAALLSFKKSRPKVDTI